MKALRNKLKMGALFVEGIQRFQKNIVLDSNSIYNQTRTFYEQEYVNIIEEARSIMFEKLQPLIIEINDEENEYDFSPKGIEADANSFKLLDHLNKIIDGLVELSKLPENDPFWESNVIKFVSKTSLNWGHMPDYYLHKFEFDRLNFGSTGSIKNMNQTKTQMMVGNFFFLKIIIKSILFFPDYNFEQEGITGVELSDDCVLKLKQIACYIYHIYLTDIVFDEENEIIPNNT